MAFRIYGFLKGPEKTIMGIEKLEPLIKIISIRSA